MSKFEFEEFKRIFKKLTKNRTAITKETIELSITLSQSPWYTDEEFQELGEKMWKMTTYDDSGKLRPEKEWVII